MSRFVVIFTFIALVVTAPGARGRAQTKTADAIARETLPANDGWGSFGTGTTGGSAATADHIYTARNRAELVAALSIGATPKIVYIAGTIDANVDASYQRVACSAYEAPGYSFAAYLAAYDPATWGRKPPAGALETARRASQANQQQRVRISVPSNTTLLGLAGATLVGVNLHVSNADNVIVRNITFVDAHDCFPSWDPNDGSTGNWNSAYDTISLVGATHVWVDHCAFSDGDNPDSRQPRYFGRPYQVHDGLLDITGGSDLITVSWNRFADHDKTMLIGGGDNSTTDPHKLRVTIHHNVFERVLQRAPRVRFGQVHVFNNWYDVATTPGYVYSWGVGVRSQIVAQNNVFHAGTVAPDRLISRFNGTAIHAAGTLVNGHTSADRVDVVAAYNATHDPDLTPVVDWTPAGFTHLHATDDVPGLVRHNAGTFHHELKP